jgi:hypothetical protein
MANGNHTTSLTKARSADAPRTNETNGLDADKEPRHCLLSPNIGGVLGLAMNGAEVKQAAELLALLYDEGSKEDATEQDQKFLWQQVVYVARMLWRTGNELYEAARAVTDDEATNGGAA